MHFEIHSLEASLELYSKGALQKASAKNTEEFPRSELVSASWHCHEVLMLRILELQANCSASVST